MKKLLFLVLIGSTYKTPEQQLAQDLSELQDYRITEDLMEELCETDIDCELFERDLNRRGYTLEQFKNLHELPARAQE